jgi:hypothetical protein
MIYFQTKNPYLGKFWRALKWVRLVYSFAIWNILLPLGTFYGHWAISWQFVIIFPRFGTLCQEKSGNPAYLCIAKTKHFEYAEFKEVFSFGHFSAVKNYTD